VISVCAVRTGSGKSQTTRHVAGLLKEMEWRVVVIRHPMPYGDLVKQTIQRFADYHDLDRFQCTIEEREEYEPHLEQGHVVYAGVDYEKILRQAETEADFILWDGGNNDLPFYESDLNIVVADPLRPGHELSYHPGEANLRMADVVVVNKIDTADYQNVLTVRANVRQVNPQATLVEAASPLTVDTPGAINGKRVLVIEDGPTLTHGEMSYGAGFIAAQRFGASEIVDPRPFAVGTVQELYTKYPQLGAVLPAMGYGAAQIADLQTTINRTDAELVIIATPIDLRRLIDINLPLERVRYELQIIGSPTLSDIIAAKFRDHQAHMLSSMDTRTPGNG
jgi:predicted GTPase